MATRGFVGNRRRLLREWPLSASHAMSVPHCASCDDSCSENRAPEKPTSIGDRLRGHRLALDRSQRTETSSSLSIRTRDNRALEGQVDSRTDQHQLWIRQQSEHIVLITPVRWDAIASAALDDAPIEIASLVEMASRLASAGPVAFLAQHEVIDPPQDVLLSAPQVHPHDPGARMTPTTRVTNIEIAARLVNFDRDVEVDGIEVAVVVLDTQGYPVPVRGSLSGNLIVERVNSHTGRARFENVQRWSQPVATADFVEGTAFYRLPFRTVRPEMDLALRSQGLLNVRLGVAGQGNYEGDRPGGHSTAQPGSRHAAVADRQPLLSRRTHGGIRPLLPGQLR